MSDKQDKVGEAAIAEAAPSALEERERPPAQAGPPRSPDERIAALKHELADMKDRMLRALAEAENTRRRAERDRRDAEQYGGVRLARDILSVFDNLDRALAASTDALRASAPDFLEGVELTHKALLAAFTKHGISPLTPAPGERFDPKRHQAMFEAPSSDLSKGTIMQLLQTGFVIGDRLLRPALVGVVSVQISRPSEENAAPDDAPQNDASPRGDAPSGSGAASQSGVSSRGGRAEES